MYKLITIELQYHFTVGCGIRYGHKIAWLIIVIALFLYRLGFSSLLDIPQEKQTLFCSGGQFC